VASLKSFIIAAAFVGVTPVRADPLDQWNRTIAEASARFGIPRQWIRLVIRAESDGQTMLEGRPIVSRAGAMGLMQLMPDTWVEMRSALGLGSNPFDPHDNIIAGSAYLRSMYDRFGYPGLFAAYNVGPTRYAAFLSGVSTLPAETRAYVANLTSATSSSGVSTTPALSRLFALKTRKGDEEEGMPGRLLESSSGKLLVRTSWIGAL
jgi:soluble lytic murein transglycosylase-like protein